MITAGTDLDVSTIDDSCLFGGGGDEVAACRPSGGALVEALVSAAGEVSALGFSVEAVAGGGEDTIIEATD